MLTLCISAAVTFQEHKYRVKNKKKKYCLDTQAVSAAKTLKERRNLIKLGLATPFSFQSTNNAQPSLKLDNAFSNSLDAPELSETFPISTSKKLTNLKVSKRKLEIEDAGNVSPKKKRSSSDSDEFKPSSPEIEIEGIENSHHTTVVGTRRYKTVFFCFFRRNG